VNYKDPPPRAERRHLNEKLSGHWDLDFNQGPKTFEHALKRSKKEHNLEKRMTRKKSNRELIERRNYLDCTSLGDKNYKFPDYCPNFFKEG